MQRLWGYIYQYRYRYARGIACLVVTATLAMSIPWLLKQAVEGIEHGRPVREVVSTLLLIIGIALLQGIVRSFSRFLIFNVGRDIEYQLRNELFAHLQTLSLSYYQRQPIGDLMSRLVNDVTAVRLLLGLGIINILNTPLYYVYAMSAMLAMDPTLTLLAVAPYPFMFVVVRAMSRQLMEHTLNVQAGLADLSSRVQESVSGMPVIRAYVREAWQNRVFAGLNERFKIENIALARLRGLFPPLMKGVSGTGLLVVLWYGGSQVIAGQLSLGDLVAFMGYLHLLAWPTMAMGWLISLYQRGKAAMQRLEVIWQTRPDIVDGTGNGARRSDAHGCAARLGFGTWILPIRPAGSSRAVAWAMGIHRTNERYCTILRLPSRPEKPLPLWVVWERARVVWSSCCRVCSTSRAAPSPLTDAIFGSSRWPSCEAVSALCPRTRFSSRPVFRTISPFLNPRWTLTPPAGRPPWPVLTPRLRIFPRAMRPS